MYLYDTRFAMYVENTKKSIIFIHRNVDIWWHRITLGIKFMRPGVRCRKHGLSACKPLSRRADHRERGRVYAEKAFALSVHIYPHFRGTETSKCGQGACCPRCAPSSVTHLPRQQSLRLKAKSEHKHENGGR